MKTIYFSLGLIICFNFSLAQFNVNAQESSIDYVTALKDTLIYFVNTNDDSLFRMSCQSIIDVINSVSILSSEDTNDLKTLYLDIIDKDNTGGPRYVENYKSRKICYIFSWISPSDGQISFTWLFTPKNWDPSKPYPLYVNLHGVWTVADSKIKFMALPLSGNNTNYAFEDGFYLYPWGRGTGIYDRDINEGVEAIENYMKIDSKRKYISGHSLGAYTAWNMASKFPEEWTAVGIHGGSFDVFSPEFDNAQCAKFRETPVYIVCGTEDGGLLDNEILHSKLLEESIEHHDMVTFEGGHDYREIDLQNMYNWMRKFRRLDDGNIINLEAPNAPTEPVLNEILGLRMANISWIPIDDSALIKNYTISVFEGESFYTSTTVPKTDTSATLFLKSGTKFKVAVSVTDTSNNRSSKSNFLSVTTLSESIPPSKPLGLKSNAIKIRWVDISWSPCTDNDSVTDYRVYVYKEDSIIDTITISGVDTSIAISDLQPQAKYSFIVSALDGSRNESDKSEVLTVTLPTDVVDPSAPAFFPTLQKGFRWTELWWRKSTDNDAVKNYIISVIKGDSVSTEIIVPGTVTETKVFGLEPGKQYRFIIYAIDFSNNESAKSSILVTTLKDTVLPSTPKILEVTADTFSVSLTWSSSTDNDTLSRYKIMVFQGTIVLDTLETADTSFIVEGLEGNTRYSFTVFAIDESENESAHSNAVTITTETAIINTNRVTNNESFKLYPNPVNVLEDIVLEIEGIKTNVAIKIYDIAGTQVFKKLYQNEKTIHIPANQFNKGMYILSLESSKVYKQQKLIIK